MSDQGDWDDDDPGWTDDEYDDGEPIEDEPAAAGADGGGRSYGWLVGLAVVLLVALGVGIAALAFGGDDDDDPSAGGSSTTLELGLPGAPGSSTTTLTPGTSTSTSTTIGVGGSSTTSTTRRPSGPTTTTTMPDGPKEPACAPLAGGGAAGPVAEGWEARWTTKPNPNDPATLSFCVDDRTPKVGQLVTLTAHAADPDAVIPDDECSVFVSWDGDAGNLCFDTLTPGPKPTPPEQAGDVVAKRTFTYGADKVGSRRIFASTTSGGGSDRSPYSSTAETTLEITVHA